MVKELFEHKVMRLLKLQKLMDTLRKCFHDQIDAVAEKAVHSNLVFGVPTDRLSSIRTDAVSKFNDEVAGAIVTEIAEMYAEEMTEEDLDMVIMMYEHPVMQKYMNLQFRCLPKYTRVMVETMTSFAPKIREYVHERVSQA